VLWYDVRIGTEDSGLNPERSVGADRMPEQGTLPSPGALAKLLSDLLMERRVSVNMSAPMRFPPPAPFVVATYKSDDGKSAVVCVCDLALASAVSAALTVIPPSVAAESVRAGRLSETLAENLHEIFNVCTALFNQPNFPHLVLDQVALGSPTLVSALAGPVAKARERNNFEISISGYGSGKFSSWAISLV